MPPKRQQIKRETDLQMISDWIEPGSRILDLGCGRGVLLEYLKKTRNTYGVGVDVSPNKIARCVRRGINVYHGDASEFLDEMPDHYFDWVILSRMVQELSDPGEIIDKALRVGRHLAVGFVNYGFWLNRWSLLKTGENIRNEVYPEPWERSHRGNPVSIHGFESFCQRNGIRIRQHAYLKGDWRTPISVMPNLLAGYAIYHLVRE